MKKLPMAVCLSFVVLAAWCETANGQGKNTKFTSERSLYPFFGATRVAIDGFDPMDKDAKSASLVLDKNEVTLNAFGDPQITAVFYKPFQVKLTRLNKADPAGKDRLMFSVELPKEFAADIGKNSLRLMTAGPKMAGAGIRLLLVNQEEKVTQVLELRPLSN